jgi:hypothetical protein
MSSIAINETKSPYTPMYKNIGTLVFDEIKINVKEHTNAKKVANFIIFCFNWVTII